jgi:hypothetical protein
MADNFDMKKFLVENKLGVYSKLREEKFYAPSYVASKYGNKAKEIEDNIHDEEDNNPNIWDLYTSLETEKETDEFVKGFMNEAKGADQSNLMAVERIEEIVNNLARNISTNSNIPTQEKLGLVQALKELKDLVEDLGANIEQEYEEKEADSFYDEDEPVSDYSRRRAGLSESNNPEGDQLVVRFLKGIAKKFDYPVSQAATFVKERLKNLGY